MTLTQQAPQQRATTTTREASDFERLMQERIGTLKLDELDSFARQVEQAQSTIDGNFNRAFATAVAVDELRRRITPDMMKIIMGLMNSALGFKTDSDPNAQWNPRDPYPERVVKEAVIEAILRGAALVGNEFNIIGGRCYMTVEFFRRKLGELPGVSDVKFIPGLPQERGEVCVVKGRISWAKDGAEHFIEREIPIKKNKGMGNDAVLGKFERKIRKAAYEQITGHRLIPDGGVGDADDALPAAPKKPSLDDLPGDKPALPDVSNPAAFFAAAATVGYARSLEPDACTILAKRWMASEGVTTTGQFGNLTPEKKHAWLKAFGERRIESETGTIVD